MFKEPVSINQVLDMVITAEIFGEICAERLKYGSGPESLLYALLKVYDNHNS